jgi:hypothetical protein
MLRASNARGSHRQRSGCHASPPTKGKAGLSPTVVWGGILALAVMIGLLLFVFYRINKEDQKRNGTDRPAHKDNSSITQPQSLQSPKQDPKADEAAFDELMMALSKLPKEDRASRVAKLESFVKAYPESICAARARIMISDLREKPTPKTK